MPSTRPTFRIFVSSSFRDLRAARNLLQDDVFPKLREFCEKQQARFQAIDLRWGLSEAAGESQQTMNICLQELYRCQRITPRPNFILLLGDRYGWRPLPAQIFEDEFQLLLSALKSSTAQQERTLLEMWYRQDTNAVPLERVLRPRSEGAFDEDMLRTVLQRAAAAAFPENDPQRNRYFDSATHQEIRHGALATADAKEHVFCYFRIFSPDMLPAEGTPVEKARADYFDLKPDGTWDKAAHGRLNDLKKELGDPFGNHVHKYDVARFDETDWHKQLVKDMLADLRGVIQDALEKSKETAKPEQAEAEPHAQFGQERSRHFTGREEELDRIARYAADPTRQRRLIGWQRVACRHKIWFRCGPCRASRGVSSSANGWPAPDVDWKRGSIPTLNLTTKAFAARAAN